MGAQLRTAAWPVKALALAGAVAVTGCGASAPDAAGQAAADGVHRYVSAAGSDRQDGSRARPWRTIAHAARRVRPGTTVHVAPGRYRGPLTIGRGGTAGRPVRFVSARRWGARISAAGSGPVAVVQILGDHVTFERFDVRGRGGDGSVGIDLEGDHDAAVGNRVHRFAAPCGEGANGAAGILIGGGANGYRNRGGLVDGNLVEQIGSGPRDGSCRLVHGIYAAVPDVRIVNNIVTGVAGDGISSWHAARALTIANNVSASNGGAGILVGSGDTAATDAGHTGTLVSNNIVYRNALSGIAETSDGMHPVGPGNRYLHNLAFANRRGDRNLRPGAVVVGALSADPRFAGGTSATRRYRPRTASPAVDAGSPADAPRHDFTGGRRPRGRGVDIGPFELR